LYGVYTTSSPNLDGTIVEVARTARIQPRVQILRRVDSRRRPTVLDSKKAQITRQEEWKGHGLEAYPVCDATLSTNLLSPSLADQTCNEAPRLLDKPPCSRQAPEVPGMVV
jgi:hypothetical protein